MRYFFIKAFLAAFLAFAAFTTHIVEGTVFVLGSGGSKGLAHVGAIEELEYLDIKPDCIVCSSVGSVVGALYAEDKDIQKVKNCLIDKSASDFLDLSFFQQNAISTRKKVEEFLEENLKATDFSDLSIKIVIVATDFKTGQPVYFSEGNLKDAILASTCVPGVYEPYTIEGRKYIDGGLSAPLPTEYAVSLNEGKVLAIDISADLNAFGEEGMLDVLVKSFEIIYQNLASEATNVADFTLEMNLDDIGSPFEDGKNQEIYEKGREMVIKNKEKIKESFSR